MFKRQVNEIFGKTSQFPDEENSAVQSPDEAASPTKLNPLALEMDI